MPDNLIARLRAKKESAFTELVLSFSHRLMTVAKVYTNSIPDAEDVLQDAFIIAFEKISLFKGDDLNAFFAWMKRVTINLALAKSRKVYKKKEISLEGLNLEPVLDEAIIAKLSQDEIMNLVFSLPVGYRQVFALFVLEGYSHKEIAEQLGIAPSTSRSQFVRAKRILQEQLNRLFKIAI